MILLFLPIFCTYKERSLQAKSIRRKYVALGQYFNFLKLEYNINEIFFRFTSRKFHIPRNLPKTLSNQEIKNLISVSAAEYQDSTSDYKRRLNTRNMCIIELLFCLGLRIGEAASLNLDDYCQEDCTILIRGKGSRERLLFISSPIVCQKLNLWITDPSGNVPHYHCPLYQPVWRSPEHLQHRKHIL